MFCHNCGNQISDNAKFCNRCGVQVAVSPQPQPMASQTPIYKVGNDISGEYVAGVPYGQYPPQQTVYIVKENNTDPERNVKIAKLIITIGSIVLMDIALIISFFGKIFKDGEESISDLIGNEYFMEYAWDGLPEAIITMFVLFILAAIFVNIPLIDFVRCENIGKGFRYAALACYLLAFCICIFNEYMDPSGLFVFLLILFMIGFAMGGTELRVRNISSGKSLSSAANSLIGAAPKHIQTSVTYEGICPDMESFELLVEKTCLREHLYKTHPSNQLFITIQQLMLQKYNEMVSSNHHTNRRVFDYTDNKNRILFTMSFDETKEFKCDIKINML